MVKVSSSIKSEHAISASLKNHKEFRLVFFTLFAIATLANLSTLLRPLNLGGPGFGIGIRIWGPFSRFQNSDSPYFMEYLRDPSMLVSPGSFWQERPGYIIFGKLLSLVTFQNNEAPFIVLNFIILCISCIFLLRTLDLVIRNHAFIVKKELLQATFSDRIIYSSFPFMVAMLNLPTRGYLWTAHFQMFNILIPILCLFHCAYVTKYRKIFTSTFILSLITGAMLLTYPGTIIYVLTILACFLYLKKIGSAFVFGMTCFLPTIFWQQYIVERNGFFFSQSTSEWKQFVWIKDALRDSNLLDSLTVNLVTFYQSFNNSYIKFVFVLTIISFILMLIMNKSSLNTLVDRTDFGLGRYLLVVYLLALYTVGTYVARLNWPIVIVSVILIWSFMIRIDLNDKFLSKKLNRPRSRLKVCFSRIFFVAPSVLWVLYFTSTVGPWS